MALPPNPQRVPLGTDINGKPVIITREWLRFLGDATGTTTPGTTDLTALTAAVNALIATVAALQARVAELETGYHV